MPGIAELVRALAARDDVVLGLLTGNIRDGARVKLAPTGCGRCFPSAPSAPTTWTAAAARGGV
jgi:hypothetical protein